MHFAKVYSAQTTLLSAHIISIEVDVSRKTLQAFTIVGLPDKAVEESRDRVSAAIKNSGFKSPKNKNEKVVVSLAPADLKKEGPAFDVGMALAYLLAEGEIAFDPDEKIFLGELSLDGYLRPIQGVLALVLEARRGGFNEVFLPKENAKEAALIDGISIVPAGTLADIIMHVNTLEDKEKEFALIPQKKTKIVYNTHKNTVDFGDIREQHLAKRGLEIAAAGGHSIALFGPPGTGKTMLARAFCHILPALSFDEMIEVTAIHSIAGALDDVLVTNPPFRSPHHTSSYVSVIGGGVFPKPGEATLSHRGVLFMDEFPEFDRRVIESLRQPLEEKKISISRAKGSATFPANFILVAAMNPCPCGNFGSAKECSCSPHALLQYQRKMSGPIMDRIDMWIPVVNIPHEKLSKKNKEKNETRAIKEKVKSARDIQARRFAGTKREVQTNSDMSSRELENFVVLNKRAEETLNNAAKTLDLSPRAYHRVIKLSRTIADLDKKEHIEESHILEALQYRPKQQQ